LSVSARARSRQEKLAGREQVASSIYGYADTLDLASNYAERERLSTAVDLSLNGNRNERPLPATYSPLARELNALGHIDSVNSEVRRGPVDD